MVVLDVLEVVLNVLVVHVWGPWPMSFSWASLSSGGPTFLSRVGRMNGFFAEFAEFPEDDWTAVNFDNCLVLFIAIGAVSVRLLMAKLSTTFSALFSDRRSCKQT